MSPHVLGLSNKVVDSLLKANLCTVCDGYTTAAVLIPLDIDIPCETCNLYTSKACTEWG